MARLAILDGYLLGEAWDKNIKKEIEFSVTPIYEQHEYTIIDDTDPNFMVVEDETGMVRTIPKNNDSYLWIVAAAIAGLLIL